MKEPEILVGIMYQPEIKFRLNGNYRLVLQDILFEGVQNVSLIDGNICLNEIIINEKFLVFEPEDYNYSSFDLFDVTIGIDFHWERKEIQRFKGSLKIIIENNKLTAINKLALEDYLISVISSEMSATSSLELLKSHAVISRSWLLAQTEKSKKLKLNNLAYSSISESQDEYIRWYDREDHSNFDVCADDHCQRYQGISRQSTKLVEEAVCETKGLLLMFNDEICDARFSKSCGGISETFENVWEPVQHNYLQSVIDNSKLDVDYESDLRKEYPAQKWIRNSPQAYCNTVDKEVLSQVLNDYDQETADFYRWEVKYEQNHLTELIKRKTGRDFGQIIDLIPIERGLSGRLIKLRIVGTNLSLTIGKELEIRKTLSESHLYSSAFTVDKKYSSGNIPVEFIIKGAGWGHGVGLCQIGAAVMGSQGFSFEEILLHYFKGATISKEY